MAQSEMLEKCSVVLWPLLQLRQASRPQQNIGKHLLFSALPFLGFNRCITTEFRTLPIEYQGIGMKKWSIEKLAKDRVWALNQEAYRSSQVAPKGYPVGYQDFINFYKMLLDFSYIYM
jgi:hypothetical protein